MYLNPEQNLIIMTQPKCLLVGTTLITTANIRTVAFNNKNRMIIIKYDDEETEEFLNLSLEDYESAEFNLKRILL